MPGVRRQLQRQGRAALGACAVAAAAFSVALVGSPVFVEGFDVAEYLKCSLCNVEKLEGPIDDCCCDIETVDEQNAQHFLPVLNDITNRTYFRFFKADLWRDCPFWQEDGMCMARDCAVCESDPNDVPARLKESDNVPAVGCGDPLAKISVGDHKPGEDFDGWSLKHRVGGDADVATWTLQDEASDGMTYIDLSINPERDTKYTGANTRRVWGSIYKENCFGGPFEGMCLEERVFQRILSGIQGSISSHVATQYSKGNGHFAPNLELYTKMLGAHSDRLKNLYFTYLFVLRAIVKAQPLLSQVKIDTGNPEDDAAAMTLLARLTDEAAPAVLRGFDESKMFSVQTQDVVASCPSVLHGLDDLHALQHRFVDEAAKKQQLKDEFRRKFHNISRIMDCVGCEKCRLWGKLEFLGVGTAMKILFEDAAGQQDNAFSLTRNEVVALVTVLKQLAESVSHVDMMRQLELKRAGSSLLAAGGGAVAAGVVVILMIWKIYRAITGQAPGYRPQDKKQE